jgi:hypothetical protein
VISCTGVQGVPEICSARRCGARDNLDTEIRYTATTWMRAHWHSRATNDALFATIMQEAPVGSRHPRVLAGLIVFSFTASDPVSEGPA